MVIVLANDDPDFVAVVAHAFHRHGHEVIESPANPAAFVAWYVARPDAVVLDVMHPDQALDALEAIRSLNTSIPIVLSTVSTDPEHIAELWRRGATAVMEKPYLLRQLIDVLETFQQGPGGEEPLES